MRVQMAGFDTQPIRFRTESQMTIHYKLRFDAAASLEGIGRTGSEQ